MAEKTLAPSALECDTLCTHMPLGTDQMTIHHGEQQLILDLARGRVLS